jgi:hypothetical protein
MGRKDGRQREVNLLDLIPKRTVEYEVQNDGNVTLLVPRFRSGLLKKLVQPRLKRPYLKVKLDELGSAVWLLCDGRRSVKDIATPLRVRFHENIEPCYDRLAVFMRQLEGNRFICYVNFEACLEEHHP